MALRFKIIVLLTALLFFNSTVSAVILNTEEAEQAELSLLQDETKVFQSIGMGIALSLARCDGIDAHIFSAQFDSQ